MKLIVDSGSSHSEWVILDDKVIEKIELPGINPIAIPESTDTIANYESHHKGHITEIYYYGSGVSNQIATDKIQLAFNKAFPKIKTTILSDIEAACISTSYDQSSIVSILGTGVNTVLYDGRNITQSIKSLGYLIEEEGSGYNIGRLISKNYLRALMPEEDMEKFRSQYLNTGEDLINMIYSHPRPNYYIASMSSFLNVCSHDLKEDILRENFNTYTLNHIKKIDNYRDYKINFVGSIAYVFQKELKESIEAIGGRVGQIIKNPMSGLIKHHINT